MNSIINPSHGVAAAAAAARPLRILSPRLPRSSMATMMTTTTMTKTTKQQFLPRPTSSNRLYSSASEKPSPPSNHASFYKTFGRPIFKVALMAIFTYQLAYYGWVRLEQNEIRRELNDTIADLEARVAELERAKTSNNNNKKT